MSGPLDLENPPTGDVAVPAPQPALLSISKEDLSKLLADAVAAGAAQAMGTVPLGTPAVQPELPDLWSPNRLMREIVHKLTWFTEREERSAYHSVDTHYPVDAADDGAA